MTRYRLDGVEVSGLRERLAYKSRATRGRQDRQRAAEPTPPRATESPWYGPYAVDVCFA